MFVINVITRYIENIYEVVKIEIFETAERKLIIEINRLYDEWEQNTITDMEYFELVSERANKGIAIINEFIEDIADKYIQDAQLQKLDREDLEKEKVIVDKRDEEYLNKELEVAIKDIKEQKRIA